MLLQHYSFEREIIGAITKPAPIPISIEATNNIGDVCIKIKPTPIPIKVVPPIAQELLSSFLVSMIYYLSINLTS